MLVVAGLIVAVLVACAALWIALQLVLQRGRLLERLEMIEALTEQAVLGSMRHDDPSRTLPVGAVAPDFELPDLEGAPRRLSEWRGRRVLLVFVEPRPGFNKALLAPLSALSLDVVSDRPMPLIVSTGDREENRPFFADLRIGWPVLIQEGREVASAYFADGTPMGYLIREDGTIAADPAYGVQSLLVAAGELPAVPGVTASAGDPARRGPQWTTIAPKAPEPLKPGVTAPIFRLPTVDGGERSLLEFRGRSVLVVFSDPECEPCEELAPRLELAAKHAPEPAIVMIGRGDAEANRRMVERHGLSFPVILQRNWEVSREYGIVAAPVAFLVDEWGIIAANVAVGVDAISQLVPASIGS